MNYTKLRTINPKLYLDGVYRGKIPSNDMPDRLAFGNAASPPLIESILGGPYAPEAYTFNPFQSFPIGGSAAYPKPWRSAAQKLQDDVYTTQIGPYAKLVGVSSCNGLGCIPDTCDPTDPSAAPVPIGIYGRVGRAIGGAFASQLTFYPQDWYEPSEGTYDHEYWSDQFNLTGNGRWQSRKEWWAAATKTVISVAYAGQIKVDVEVATGMKGFDDSEYFRGLDLAVYNDYSLEMLTVMVAVAASIRWL